LSIYSIFYLNYYSFYSITKITKMETKELQKPFFAQFLEGDKAQALQKDLTKPLYDAQTNKYPSDGDDDWPPDWVS
jgi:hypothetical protein